MSLLGIEPRSRGPKPRMLSITPQTHSISPNMANILINEAFPAFLKLLILGDKSQINRKLIHKPFISQKTINKKEFSRNALKKTP